jgi:hypothetical protein
MPIEDFIIEVYCLVEVYLKKLLKGKRLRQSGPTPDLTDAEVITMEIVGEFIGHHEDKAIWNYFKWHWLTWFPKLGSRKTFVKQAAHLWHVKEKLQELLAIDMQAFDDTIHFFDGFPLPVCRFKRAGYSTSFRGDASYGYCASKAERYYGFKGHLIISLSGIATRFTVAPAHDDERDGLPELTEGFHGLLIADKGLIRPELNQALVDKGILLQTPLRKNMKDTRPKWFVRKIVSMRRLIETVISQLTERFNIENIRAKKLWHFLRRVTRKILAHTIAFAINKTLNINNPLQFQRLITP